MNIHFPRTAVLLRLSRQTTRSGVINFSWAVNILAPSHTWVIMLFFYRLLYLWGLTPADPWVTCVIEGSHVWSRGHMCDPGVTCVIQGPRVWSRGHVCDPGVTCVIHGSRVCSRGHVCGPGVTCVRGLEVNVMCRKGKVTAIWVISMLLSM